MGGKIFFGFIAVAVLVLAIATPVFTNLRGLIQQTFSSGGTLVAEIPLATSTRAASLQAGAAAKPKSSASAKKTAPAPQIEPVVSVTPPLAFSTSSTSGSRTLQVSSTPPALSVPSSASDAIARGRVLISEIMVGSDGNAKYEFIELYNPTDQTFDLTGYSVRKKSSTGTESSLVAASRLESKSILPGHYFLLANSGGYDSAVPADVLWPASYSLAAKSNAIAVYNGNGEKVEEVAWQEIPPGSSLARADWSGNQFNLTANPTPQNSQSL